MAKALLGHLSSTNDPRVLDRLLMENRRLRKQVEDLESVVLRLRAENDSLAAAVHHSPLLTLDETMQPA